MKVKILMALMGLEIGGAETHVVELVKEMKRQGYDVLVVSNGGVYEKELQQAGIRHYWAPMHKRNPLLMARSLGILRRVIRQEHPDIVHAHARIPAFLCGILHKTMHFTFVTTAHWVFDTSGALRFLTNWGQKTVAVSEDIKTYLMDNYSVPAENIFVTINGIDTEKFSPEISGEALRQEFDIPAQAPVLSYVSRMDESRALVARQLIEIAPPLAEKIPQLRLLIVGGGDVYDELLSKAQEVNRQLGYECILMPGARTDINQVVAAGKIFVGVSRAALEAMAAAKPVIVAGNEGYIGIFNQERLPLAQENNFCCRGCPMSSTERLLEDVLSLMGNDEEQLVRLGNYGREVILQYYSVQRMVSDCRKAYAAALPRQRVLLSGYYGFENLGDDAILKMLRDQILQADPQAQLVVLSKDPEEARRQYGVEAIPRFHLLQIARELRRCTALISGGGSLLQDRTSTRSLLYYAGIIRWAKHMHKPVMFFANGIGPVTQEKNRRRVRRVAEQADLITLRDQDSLEELYSMKVENPHIHVTADPVYRMNSFGHEKGLELIAQNGIPLDQPLLGISVRFTEGMEEILDEFAAFCDDIVELGCTPVFLVMQPPVDRAISQQVQQKMKHKAYYVEAPYQPEAMMSMIGCMSIVISTRLHTIIFAAKQRIPVLGLVYDPKVEACLKALQMPDIGTPQNFDRKSALNSVKVLLESREEYVQRLDETVREQETKSLENEQYLQEFLQRL